MALTKTERTNRWKAKQQAKGLCLQCIDFAVPNRLFCAKHLAKNSKRSIASRHKNFVRGLCRQCASSIAEGRTHCQECLNKKKEAGRKHKKIVIDHYGGICIWPDCNITDLDVLTLDHVFNDGFKERISGNAFYFHIIKNEFPEGKYQVLCWNHQWKKRMLLLRGEPLLLKAKKQGAGN